MCVYSIAQSTRHQIIHEGDQHVKIKYVLYYGEHLFNYYYTSMYYIYTSDPLFSCLNFPCKFSVRLKKRSCRLVHGRGHACVITLASFLLHALADPADLIWVWGEWGIRSWAWETLPTSQGLGHRRPSPICNHKRNTTNQFVVYSFNALLVLPAVC